MHISYDCSNKDHLSPAFPKPWKLRIHSVDIKGLMAVAMDARDVAKKAKQAKESGKAEEDFQAGQW